MTEITHRTIQTNGINMHIAEAGEGPLVLLIHGFPEFWYSWRHQLPALAAAGYHPVAPDVRGSGDTDKPHEIKAPARRERVADGNRLPAFLPDWAVYDDRHLPARPGNLPTTTSRHLAAGFFDDHWRLAEPVASAGAVARPGRRAAR